MGTITLTQEEDIGCRKNRKSFGGVKKFYAYRARYTQFLNIDTSSHECFFSAKIELARAPRVHDQTHEGGGGVYCSPRMVIRPVFGTVTGDLLIFELCLVFTNLSPIVNACSTTINTCFFPSSFSPSISIHDSSDLETHALGYPITSGDSHEARATYDESHEFQRLHIFSSYLA